MQAVNLELTDEAGRTVTVPARDRVEVRFPMTTAEAGTARLLVGATSGDWADAAQLELPVYTPATAEAFATYGVIDEGAIAQPIVPPVDVFPQFGGLEITTSSTALQALTDAVIYLVSYPFECSSSSPRASWRSPRCATSSRPSRPRACPRPPSWTPRSRGTSPCSRHSRTTTAGSPCGRAAASRGRSTPSTPRTPWRAPGRRTMP